MPRVVHAVDCSERFPTVRFALTPSDAALLAPKVNGFSPLYMRKKPVQLRSSSTGDPCLTAETGGSLLKVLNLVIGDRADRSTFPNGGWVVGNADS